MNTRARSQVRVATFTAVVALGAAVVPATIQLFDEDEAPTAVAPVESVVAPPTTTPTAEPSGNGQREGGRGRGERREGGGGGEP